MAALAAHSAAAQAALSWELHLAPTEAGRRAAAAATEAGVGRLPAVA